MKTTRRLLLVLIVLLLTPSLALAIITFDQLDEETFIVSHRIKAIGSRGKAMSVVYEKAASLCVAAGFTHYEVLDQSSEAAQEHDTANASLTVRFFSAKGDRRIACSQKASARYIEQAAVKLRKQGYRRSDSAGTPAADPPATPSNADSNCTVEQIATMLNAGLSTAQVEAACEEDD